MYKINAAVLAFLVVFLYSSAVYAQQHFVCDGMHIKTVVRTGGRMIFESERVPPASGELMFASAYPLTSMGVEFENIFVYPYDMKQHTVSFSRFSELILIWIDGKFYGARVFSNAGLETLIRRKYEPQSISFPECIRWTSHKTIENLRKLKSVKYLINWGFHDDLEEEFAKYLRGSKVQYSDWFGSYFARERFRDPGMHLYEFRIKATDSYPDVSMLSTVHPVSLELEIVMKDFADVEEVIREIPASVRHLSLQIYQHVEDTGKIVSLLNERLNLDSLYFVLTDTMNALHKATEVSLDSLGIYDIKCRKLSVSFSCYSSNLGSMDLDAYGKDFLGIPPHLGHSFKVDLSKFNETIQSLSLCRGRISCNKPEKVKLGFLDLYKPAFDSSICDPEQYPTIDALNFDWSRSAGIKSINDDNLAKGVSFLCKKASYIGDIGELLPIKDLEPFDNISECLMLDKDSPFKTPLLADKERIKRRFPTRPKLTIEISIDENWMKIRDIVEECFTLRTFYSIGGWNDSRLNR